MCSLSWGRVRGGRHAEGSSEVRPRNPHLQAVSTLCCHVQGDLILTPPLFPALDNRAAFAGSRTVLVLVLVLGRLHRQLRTSWRNKGLGKGRPSARPSHAVPAVLTELNEGSS